MKRLIQFSKLASFLASWINAVGADAFGVIWNSARHMQFQHWVEHEGRAALVDFLSKLFETPQLQPHQQQAVDALCTKVLAQSSAAVEQLALGGDPDEVAARFRLDAGVTTLAFVADMVQ